MEIFFKYSRRHSLIFTLVILLVICLKAGIWYIPNIGATLAIALDPFTNPFQNNPMAHYLMYSWLGSFLAWLLGITTKNTFILFHLFFTFCFFFSFVIFAYKNVSRDNFHKSLILFCLFPVSYTAFYWSGMDSITLFLLMLCIIARSNIVALFILGILLALQHFEQALLAVVCLLGMSLFSSYEPINNLKFKRSSIFFLLIGLLAGKILLHGIFAYNNIELNSGRIYYLLTEFWQFLAMFWYNGQVILWGIFGLGWLPVFVFHKMEKPGLISYLIIFCCCLLSVISGDQTRVLAIVSFLYISTYIVLNDSFLDKLSSTFLSIVFCIWLLLPIVWVWGGVPRRSVLPFDITFLISLVRPVLSVPADPSAWPF